MSQQDHTGDVQPWIVFDFFGVVARDRTLEYLGNLQNSELSDRMMAMNREKDLGNMGLEDYIRDVAILLGIDEEKARWLECPADTARPDVTAFVHAMSKQYKIAVASNCYAASLRRAIVEAGIESALDLVLTSSEIHAVKPERDFWERASQRLGVANSQIYFIDDRLENVSAASEFGWHAIQFSGVDNTRRELAKMGLHLE